LLLSDGLPELKNIKNEPYSYKHVYDAFKLTAEKQPEDIITDLKNEAAQ
jgi:hypothetical protein